MSFRFYTDAVSRASRAFAAGTFITGLLLMGFGTIILALPEIFAFLAAAVFFIAGLGCTITAVKIFLAMRKMKNTDSDDSQNYRVNVRVHTDDE